MRSIHYLTRGSCIQHQGEGEDKVRVRIKDKVRIRVGVFVRVSVRNFVRVRAFLYFGLG
jgi:hypothetical protein